MAPSSHHRTSKLRLDGMVSMSDGFSSSGREISSGIARFARAFFSRIESESVISSAQEWIFFSFFFFFLFLYSFFPPFFQRRTFSVAFLAVHLTRIFLGAGFNLISDSLVYSRFFPWRISRQGARTFQRMKKFLWTVLKRLGSFLHCSFNLKTRAVLRDLNI